MGGDGQGRLKADCHLSAGAVNETEEVQSGWRSRAHPHAHGGSCAACAQPTTTSSRLSCEALANQERLSCV